MLKVIVGNASAITVDAVVCACRSASENNPDYIVADCECRGVQSPTTSGLSLFVWYRTGSHIPNAAIRRLTAETVMGVPVEIHKLALLEAANSPLLPRPR
jgi:hypothetical protein